MKKIYSIQGVIFQRGHIYGTAYKPGIGIAATIKNAMIYAMFHGVVGPDETAPETFCGSMTDKFGDSQIAGFQVTNKELRFDKYYKNRPVIHYIFTKKEGDVWLGTYSGEDCGKGETKCTLTCLDETFFEFKE